jgi:gas vesicle protein
METNVNIKRNDSNIWPYVIVGSAIGGAVGYLFMSESGKKIRHAMAHPDELANNLEEARGFLEGKAKVVTDQVHDVLDKAKRSIEEGERAYREAEISFHSRARQLEGKNDEIASNVHKTVDNMKTTAVTIEQSVLDPIFEMAALYKGVERGIRTILGKTGSTGPAGPTPIYRDTRIVSD